MLHIAKKLDVEITYSNRAFRFDNEIVIRRGTKSEEWLMFGHELCHYLRHSGNQLKMGKLFVDLQEWQADNFMYHFCIPSFMLRRMNLPDNERDAVWLLQEVYGVTAEFAQKRLQQYMQNLIYR
ncbi:ImmA/IrrE family metallo-endopeptidase [Planomicrobium sp. YIM 101495]|nr:ImmA/IrrE family metallo-endopeptidase [Planomicrobium sp. YIM 101495]